jgi:uncharacterized protein
MKMRLRNFLFLVVFVLGSLALAVWGAILVLKPGPEGKLVLASGGASGAYNELALAYKKELARFGVDVELHPLMEGRDTLRALFVDPNSDIQAGFIKGGIAASLQGRFATAEERHWHDRQVEALQSVGRVFYEPVWVFYGGSQPLSSLRELKGKKIYVGTKLSGGRRIALYMLRANGIDETNSTLIEEDLPADGAPLISGDANAAFLVLPTEARTIQQLLRNPNIHLMDFTAEAEAYADRIPALSARVMNQGAVEFNPDIPPSNITLVGTTAALVVRKDVHPAIVELLAHAVIHNPKPGFDLTGEPILFYRAGEFPTGNDPEFEVAPDVRRLYKTGELPFTLRDIGPLNQKLGMPFWVTAFVYQHGTRALLLAIPLLTVLWPLARFLPWLYPWTVRRRLLYWYRQLKVLETTLDQSPTLDHLAEKQEELDRIDRAVSRIRVPLPFADQLYDLRGHIELVSRRLAQREAGASIKVAAE